MRRFEGAFLAFWVAWILSFRQGKHLTQEKMAERICLTPRNYQKLECGVHLPSATTLTLFLGQLSDQEILSFVRSFARQVEVIRSQEAA